MELAPMRYKNFVWPHNPMVYTIDYKREVAVHKVPFDRYHLQDLGFTQRVMKGRGEFVGEKAYETFKALASVFYQEGPGVLVHPVWQAANVYFVELSLAQEPRKDYVQYTFTFWEGYDGYRPYARSVSNGGEGAAASPAEQQSGEAAAEAAWHTVVKGETIWSIARRYAKTVTEVITLNPQIKNPNLIYPGERVRIQ